MADRQDLMDRNGIRFIPRPKTSRFLGWGHSGHMGRAPAEELPALRALIAAAFDSGARYFVLSHENSLGRPFEHNRPGLYPSRDQALRTIAPAFEPFPKKLVYYIRAQDEFLESYYLQTVNEGSGLPFAEWLRQLDTSDLSWRPVVESLQRTFGSDAVDVRDFTTEMAGGQQVFLRRAFAAFGDDLGPEHFNDFNYIATTNVSLGAKGLNIALAINRFAETAEERAKIRKFLQENFSNRSYPRPILLTDENRAELQSRYRAENRALVQTSPATGADV
jgi:hypothetical protein